MDIQPCGLEFGGTRPGMPRGRVPLPVPSYPGLDIDRWSALSSEFTFSRGVGISTLFLLSLLCSAFLLDDERQYPNRVLTSSKPSRRGNLSKRRWSFLPAQETKGAQNNTGQTTPALFEEKAAEEKWDVRLSGSHPFAASGGTT